MSGHRAAHDLAQAAGAGVLSIEDPGNAGIINVDRQGICDMVSVGAAETRTMPNPAGAGLRVCIRLNTDGGDVAITAANGWNVAGNTIGTYADAGDYLDVISVTHTTGFRWEIITNVGVAMS